MYTVIDSPLGKLTLAEEEGKLTHLLFGEQCLAGVMGENDFLLSVKKQLDEYFAGERKFFEIPVAPQGTDFQKKVWAALQQVKYGHTASYGQIAKMIGNPGACRAVGGANNKNPISIVIPCHRIVGADGSLTGYGGGMDKKVFLLQLEKQNK